MAGLSEQEIRERLADTPGWARLGIEIMRSFIFETFAEGIAFVVDVARLADEMDHHPDIDIRYNKIKVAMTSHDTGGLTERDFRLAAGISGLETAGRATG